MLKANFVTPKLPIVVQNSFNTPHLRRDSKCLQDSERSIHPAWTSLYGEREAEAHWYNTYQSHNNARLNMIAVTYDSCLLYIPKLFSENIFPKKLWGKTCLQTNDSLTACNEPFSAIKKNESAAFSCKPWKGINCGQQLQFNEATTNLFNLSNNPSHNCQFDNSNVLDTNHFSKADFIHQRARLAYIALAYRSDLTFLFNVATDVTEPTKADVIALNEAINFALLSKDEVLKFGLLDLYFILKECSLTQALYLIARILLKLDIWSLSWTVQ